MYNVYTRLMYSVVTRLTVVETRMKSAYWMTRVDTSITALDTRLTAVDISI